MKHLCLCSSEEVGSNKGVQFRQVFLVEISVLQIERLCIVGRINELKEVEQFSLVVL